MLIFAVAYYVNSTQLYSVNNCTANQPLKIKNSICAKNVPTDLWFWYLLRFQVANKTYPSILNCKRGLPPGQ